MQKTRIWIFSLMDSSNLERSQVLRRRKLLRRATLAKVWGGGREPERRGPARSPDRARAAARRGEEHDPAPGALSQEHPHAAPDHHNHAWNPPRPPRQDPPGAGPHGAWLGGLFSWWVAIPIIIFLLFTAAMKFHSSSRPTRWPQFAVLGDRHTFRNNFLPTIEPVFFLFSTSIHN